MSLTARLLLKWRPPRVVHRLPGRVRVAVPQLKLGNVPSGAASLIEQVRPLFLVPDGIEDVEASLTTGSLLVRYDERQLDESRVLQWITLLCRLVAEHWRQLDVTDPARAETLVARLEGVLRSYAASEPSFERLPEIPPDVWR
jgi:hypothetical protein